MTTQRQQLYLARTPEPGPLPGDVYELRAEDIKPLSEGQILVRVMYISVDAGARGMLDNRSPYVLKLKPGDPIIGSGMVGEVVESRHSDYPAGTLLCSQWVQWASHLTLDPSDPQAGIRKISSQDIPGDAYLGVLGMVGFTAHIGLFEIFSISREDTVVISAAAGGVGSAAGQFARAAGARVVGVAGGEEKCRFVKDQLGLDECLDYRQDLAAQLDTACADGVSFYFDNVGGQVQQIVYRRMNEFGRIALCGQVSQYSGEGTPPGPNLMDVVLKRLSIKGFLAFDHYEAWPGFIEQAESWYRSGKLKHYSNITRGLDQAHVAVNSLVNGNNYGKQLIGL